MRPPSNGSRSLAAVEAELEEVPEVDVRVLGPVEVFGRPAAPRAKSLEVVVYLAMPPEGVDSDKVRWALAAVGFHGRCTEKDFWFQADDTVWRRAQKGEVGHVVTAA